MRPYQQQGLNWLAFLWQLGFGTCLADDMGVGKTVQLLALVDTQRKTAGVAPALLVIPASLLANWQAEIARFFPSLRVFILASCSNPIGLRACARLGIVWARKDRGGCSPHAQR